MNTTINVEPGKLEETAARVEACDGDYQRLYRSLYAEVDKLSGNWGGKDNLALTARSGLMRRISARSPFWSDSMRLF